MGTIAMFPRFMVPFRASFESKSGVDLGIWASRRPPTLPTLDSGLYDDVHLHQQEYRQRLAGGEKALKAAFLSSGDDDYG